LSTVISLRTSSHGDLRQVSRSFQPDEARHTHLVELVNGRGNCSDLVFWHTRKLKDSIQDFAVVQLQEQMSGEAGASVPSSDPP
jgi:hypothetical protein